MSNIVFMESMIKYHCISFVLMLMLSGTMLINILSKLTIQVSLFLMKEFNVKLSEFKN